MQERCTWSQAHSSAHGALKKAARKPMTSCMLEAEDTFHGTGGQRCGAVDHRVLPSLGIKRCC
jgi:hypothetical protein